MTQSRQYRVNQDDTTFGEYGERHLVEGESSGMRLWQREEPNDDKSESTHDYEILGYVIQGRMDLIVNGETVSLAPGDSYYVPRGAPHTFRVTETLTAVEVTSPATDS